MNLILNALRKQNDLRPPVWMMRQAGRYHSHYQELKKRYSFWEICTLPEVACEATLGPIRDFGFDAGILFSDLLFPLDAMGMGLRYPGAGPELEWHLTDAESLKKLQPGSVEKLAFQGEALRLIRNSLSAEKALLGFVGGPWTLFCYAVEGRHQGSLNSSKMGLEDGRFAGFFEILLPLLVENMVLQANSGADAVAILDTCAGEVDPLTYRERCVPALNAVITRFKERCPSTPVIYYSKGTGPDHWKSLVGLNFDCLGVDWRHDIAGVLADWSDKWAIQGNIDPSWLFLKPEKLTRNLDQVFRSVAALKPAQRRGWICGLGHGVLPGTPEANVRLFIELQKKYF